MYNSIQHFNEFGVKRIEKIASIYCRKKKSRWHPIFYTTISNNGLLVTRVFCIICMLS
ncbi:hypothetical protein HVS_09170 [Acetivibrio saccincola]|uniref:Uncharacterized protein n=1 Tax=Acetivibrio saccincola TaxID=1677857 RepID=A0A2K9E5T6_9FIRM|nr:hypothetical protein HVS_09170 [Acetivibrio saccincola]